MSVTAVADTSQPEPSALRRRGGGGAKAPRWRSALPVTGCILVFLVLGFLAYGATPPASNTILPLCGCGDLSSQVWFAEWPAYALAHGLNPLYSSFVNLPRGLNLMDNTGAPLLGIVFAPVTLAIGPVATLNLLFRLGFALSGISMFLVLRRLVRWWPAAFAGGLLFAFSPFMVGQSQSHDFLTFDPLPPIMLALFEAVVIRRSNLWRNGALLGLVFAAQLMISPEVLSMCVVTAVSALVVLALRHPVAARERAMDLLRTAAAGAGAFIVLAGYPIWVYLRGPYHLVGPPHPLNELVGYHSAVRSLIYPTNLERISFGWLAKGLALIQGNGVEHTTYLGIPMLVVLAFLFVRARRSGLVQLFTLVALVGWAVTLGVSGHHKVLNSVLPYNVIRKIPLVNGGLDLRYSLVMYFAVAVVLAAGLDVVHEGGLWPARHGKHATTTSRLQQLSTGPAVRVGAPLVLAAIGLAPLVPLLPYPNVTVSAPGVFTGSHSVIPTGARVLLSPLPIDYEGSNDQVLLWQALSGMRFRIVGFRGAIPGPNGKPLRGAKILLPPSQAEKILVWAVYGHPTPPPLDGATEADIRTYLRRYDIDDVAIVPTGSSTSSAVKYYQAALGRAPRVVTGVYVWPHVQFDLRHPVEVGAADKASTTTTG